MIKIEGRVKNLQIEDSKIHTLKNIEKQAVGSAMLGTLASSSTLMTNAPIMLMAARGIDAKTFTCEVSDYKVIGQFTTVHFKDNDPLILVISEEKEQGRHLVYSVLEPKTGLLYMMYEMGRSLKKLYISTVKSIFLLFLSLFTFFSVLFLFLNFLDGGGGDYIKYGGVIFLSCLIFSIIFMLGYITIGNSVISLSKISEKIFYKLGFQAPENQDFFQKSLIDMEGIHVSVMEYRKNLKGPDPYPEDYFDKKKVSE
ncbi:putative type VI secretion system effector [Acinetobacter courvalinii]|uniref:putative type VI secretion system effector n=1 Tax=Acinetobacter courvalinii TaxID=280147 RepID=UPI0021D30442|nr:putative type VI secretion system effector [Acinetobacter courvalinii]MCU4370206.1 hypothetical protein [Acinetobacter courvalinii]MCU4448411.1 hypothetical protein [Acinetobacter courvalinii]